MVNMEPATGWKQNLKGLFGGTMEAWPCYREAAFHSGSWRAQSRGSIFSPCHFPSLCRQVTSPQNPGQNPRIQPNFKMAPGLVRGSKPVPRPWALGFVRGVSCLSLPPPTAGSMVSAGLRPGPALSVRHQMPGQDTCGETVRVHSALWGFLLCQPPRQMEEEK